jgi:hypothetical protein
MRATLWRAESTEDDSKGSRRCRDLPWTVRCDGNSAPCRAMEWGYPSVYCFEFPGGTD